MELLDRALMRKMLETLAEGYPHAVDAKLLMVDPQSRETLRHVAYLAEHGLVENEFLGMLDAGNVLLSSRLTARGLDFLQDDGGLTAVLNVVTVRLDAETIRGLIEERIEADKSMPQAEKSLLMDWVKTAGKEALSEATKRLITAALDQAPSVLQLLQVLKG